MACSHSIWATYACKCLNYDYLNFKHKLSQQIGGSRADLLELKVAASTVVKSGLEGEVECIPQQMHELRHFPVPDHHKLLQNRFFTWCEVGACSARCCALSLALAPGPSQREPGNWQGGQHPSEPAQAPRQAHRTSPKPPDTNHDRGVQSFKRR
jgi:hypothetical protein